MADKFLLLNGSHQEVSYTDDGKGGLKTASAYYEFSKDRPTEVLSDRPLDQMFPDRFQRLTGEPPPPAPMAAPGAVSGFGPNSLGDRHTFDTSKSSAAGTDESPTQKAKTTKAAKGGTSEPADDYGDDVTDKFDRAGEAGVKVYHSGRNYTVVSEKTGKPIHREDVTRMDDVKGLIDDEID